MVQMAWELGILSGEAISKWRKAMGRKDFQVSPFKSPLTKGDQGVVFFLGYFTTP